MRATERIVIDEGTRIVIDEGTEAAYVLKATNK
jgi:hypothetical protein